MSNPAPQQLNEEQISRLIVAIENLKNTNAMAAVISRSLEKGGSREYQRNVLVTAFAQAYDLMLVMNMAVTTNISPVDFKQNLEAGQNG